MNVDGTKWTCSKTEARMLLAYASKEVARENLCGIRLNPVKNKAAATDGHRLIVLDVSGMALGVVARTIPRDVWESRLRGTPGRADVVFDIEADGVDLTFPPYEQVIPTGSPGGGKGWVGLDASYVSDLHLCAKAGHRHLRMEVRGPLDLVVFRGMNVVVGIMPVRM